MYMKTFLAYSPVWTLIALLAAISLLPQYVWAQAKVGTAGVTFLKISPSCRAVGMGQSGA